MFSRVYQIMWDKEKSSLGGFLILATDSNGHSVKGKETIIFTKSVSYSNIESINRNIHHHHDDDDNNDFGKNRVEDNIDQSDTDTDSGVDWVDDVNDEDFGDDDNEREKQNSKNRHWKAAEWLVASHAESNDLP